MDNFYKTQTVCRVCLVENNEGIRSQSVFNTIDSTGEPQQFSEMLMTFAEVEITSGDDLPDQICSTCAQKTIELYLFKIQCEESDKTLRNRLKEASFIVIDQIDIDEEDIFDKIKPEMKEENVEESGFLQESGGDSYCVQQNENNPLDTIVYEDCTSPKYSEVLNTFNSGVITTNSTLSIAEESLEDDLSQEKNFLHRKKIAEIDQEIKIIDQKFDSERPEINKGKYTTNGVPMKSLVIILEDCNKTSSLKNSIKKPLLTSGKKKSFNESKNVRQHSVRHDFTKSTSLAKRKLIGSKKNPFECDVCNKKLSSSSTLKEHKRIHTGEKPYECDVCKQSFIQSSTLMTHKRTHTGEKPNQCNICKRRFNQSSHLVRHHKRTHTGEKPFECDVCKKRFTSSSNLVVHRRKHTGEMPYECDICKNRFRQSSHLVRHKLIHTGEKPYECDVCKMRFNQSSTLIAHKRRHTGEKPYECDVCKQSFIQSSALIAHKRTHTGEKPYQCNICKMWFNHSCSLISHKRIHTGEKPYECDYCKERFTTRSNLIVHKRTHTGEKPYECDFCKQRFTHSSSLIIHKRNIHS